MDPQNQGGRTERGNGQRPEQIGEHHWESHPAGQGSQEQRWKGETAFSYFIIIFLSVDYEVKEWKQDIAEFICSSVQTGYYKN